MFISGHSEELWTNHGSRGRRRPRIRAGGIQEKQGRGRGPRCGWEEPKEKPGKAQTPLLLPFAESPSEILRGDNRERKGPTSYWRRRGGLTPNTCGKDASRRHTESNTATTHRAKKNRTKERNKRNLGEKIRRKKEKELSNSFTYHHPP